MEVFVLHWVLDRTGLGLGLGSTSPVEGFKPKCPGSVWAGGGAGGGTGEGAGKWVGRLAVM